MALINLNPALEKAREDFKGGVPERMAARARVPYDENDKIFRVPFLGGEYRVSYPGGEVSGPGGAGAPPAVRVLLLHYLAGASGIPLNGRLVSFKELPGGSIYVGPFTQRAVTPLVKFFSDKPDRLVEAAVRLGGSRYELGDVAVTVPFFPLVPLIYVLWLGDEEFPPSGNVLFDSTAATHLPTEDYAVMAGMGVFELKKTAGI
ncbi:MAG: DUF3786 domain-containing protein [Peptococcaceae bacterium]|nr:DUF3786 domain-containing protein [Peptococcaceae bacterium]